MKKFVLLKLLGLSILTMIVLIIFSILEVAVYSYLINPNQPIAFYDEHANQSAPYVSAIAGFLIFFLVARYWKKKEYPNGRQLSFLFPLTYIVMDLLLISLIGVDWSVFAVIFAIANVSKFMGSYLGYRLS